MNKDNPIQWDSSPLTKKNTSYLGDVLKLVSGTAFSQVLLILISPILSRLYAPEAFGIAAVFTSVTSIIGGIACLRYELAIMLPSKDEDAANVFLISLLSVILVSAVTVPIFWFGKAQISNIVNAPELEKYLWLAPIAIFFSGLFLALNYWNSRTKHYGRLSIARISSASITAISQVGAGYVGGATSGGLISSAVLGGSVSSSVLGWQIWRDNGRFLLRSINRRSFLHLLLRFRRFPLYEIWSHLLNTISWQLPVFLLTAFFSPVVVGYYSIGYRVLSLPMSFVGSAIAQVFYQRASEAKEKNILSALVENILHVLVISILGPMLVLSLIGQDLFGYIFGSNWTEAGLYVQILSAWTFFWFISSPISSIYGVLEKHRQSLGVQIAIFLSRLISLWAGFSLGSPRLAIALFSMSGVLVYGYLVFSIVIMAGVKSQSIVRIFLEALKPAIPIVVVLPVLQAINIHPLIVLLVAGLLIVFYYWYLINHNLTIRGLVSSSPIIQRIPFLNAFLNINTE